MDVQIFNLLFEFLLMSKYISR